MDIFRFRNPVADTKFEQGEIVNGLKSKMWIERYDKAGEFKLVANVSSGVKDHLPIGSFISHVNTSEVMIIENHEISEDRGKETEIIISGRGFETFFENRIVGSNKYFPTSTGNSNYFQTADFTWNQTVNAITQHADAAILLDDDNAITYMHVMTDLVFTGVEDSVYREFQRKDLYSTILELLAIDNLGIKVIRPGPWSPLGAADDRFVIFIHKGVDRTSNVIFSYNTGEIESADYLWSNKKVKNTAVVYGKWVEILVTTGGIEYERRVMLVNASDIDDSYTVEPTGTPLADIQSAMQQRGIAALSAQNYISLTKAEVSKDVVKSGYRTDFNVGDLITVNGDYNTTTTRRISEYVEIEDENGSSGYPTLTTI